MARTQAPDYEQRREFIIEQAARLFAARGFHGTSIADLAAACQTSKSLIYHYYPSKEDILDAVMSSHIDQLGGAADEIMASALPARERLAAFTRTFLRLYVGAADRQKVLLNELANLPEEKRARVVADQRRLIALVEDVLAQLDPPLAENPVRRRAAAMLFFGMINWTHTWFNPAGPLSADDLSEMSSRLLLDGIAGLG